MLMDEVTMDDTKHYYCKKLNRLKHFLRPTVAESHN